jgi:UDP-GlcNAc:undecaprenyl-phosphate GlcNAc-1-phosphate transferase
MIRVGRLDHPVERSSHSVPTPKGGGVGILAGFTLGMLVLVWWGAAASSHALPMVAAVLLLGAISYLDDLFDWPFLAKLAAQAAAACVVILGGQVLSRLALPNGTAMVLAPLSVPALAVTLAWFLFVTNAVNFMDGLNGLASGCVALAVLPLAIAAGGELAAEAGLLAAALAGFLPFNYPRARIFMGDVGSQVCGFLVAYLAVQAAPVRSVSLAVPFALLPLLLDAGYTLARRAARGDRLTQAHRGHLYQVAHRAGVAAWAVTFVYWLLAAWGGVLGLASGIGWSPLWRTAGLGALAVLPFGIWAIFVGRAAKRAGLTAW